MKDLAEIRQSLQEETEAFRHVVVSTGNGLREAMASAAGDEVSILAQHDDISDGELGTDKTAFLAILLCPRQ